MIRVADYLITGDRDFEAFNGAQGTMVVTASRFLGLFVK
jgi:hypothetical protein